MGDGDGEHDLDNLEPFLTELRRGRDLVVGNRFAGGGAGRGGSPPGRSRVHNLGARFLSACGVLMTRAGGYPMPARDWHCGLRGFRRDRMLALGLTGDGMEASSEILLRASVTGLDIAEVPIAQLPGADRSRRPHLRPLRDGCRHLWVIMRLGLPAVAKGRLLRRLRRNDR